jgi:DNA segregation ATPase FtsK/SpoIIIE-like protein
MATKKTQAAPRGGKAKPKTNASTGAPPGSGRASQVIGVLLMALGVFSGYLMWSEARELNELLARLRDVLRGVTGMLSYAMPVMLCGLGAVTMFVGRGRIKPVRALLMAAAVLIFGGIWHVFAAKSIAQTMITHTYREFIRASYSEGMGACHGAGSMGALTSWHAYRFLGEWGAAAALMGVLMIIAITLSRTSVREVSERLSERIAGGVDEYRERRQVRGREKAELRAQALERRVAREERERERREERERLMEEERARYQNARIRVDELEERRRAMARPERDDARRHMPRREDMPPRREWDEPDSAPDAQHAPCEQAAQPSGEKAAAGGEADVREQLSAGAAAYAPEERAAFAQPVGEDALESVKSRTRGDQQAYNEDMRKRMAQEGVPMFLDKRVPGRAITSAGLAPLKAAEAPAATAEAARMVFMGYDEPGAPREDDASYAPGEYAVSPLPEPPQSVLDISDMQKLPDTSRVDELLSGERPMPSEGDVTMRPLRSTRDVELDELAHGSAAMRRIAGARRRADAQQERDMQCAQPVQCDAGSQYNQPAQCDAGSQYNQPVQCDAGSQYNQPAQCDADAQYDADLHYDQPDAEPAFSGARYCAVPAAGSAYAAGTAYEDGMPYERYVTGALPTDAGASLPDYVPPASDAHAAKAQSELPDYMPDSEELPELEPIDAVEGDELPDLDDYDDITQPVMQPAHAARKDESRLSAAGAQYDPAAQDSGIAFDGYAGEGGVNEEIAVSHTPEIVPETAARVAMYTPAEADLDRQYGSGTRPDGTPIRMPKPAMEEIPQDKPYYYPPMDLLKFSQTPGVSLKEQQELDAEKALKLEQTLQSFGIQAKVVGVSRGPAVTRFEMTPGPGVRVSKISNLSDDIALNLAATTVRIEAPIPGKSAVGIELPNEQREMVTLRDVLDSPEARKAQSKLAVALGKDNAGKLVIADIAKMPHVLIAGATGSGKSVCINTIIMSIIYRATPDEVRLILIDPKVVELSVYNGVPHLLVPVVTDPKKAASALNWAVLEMTERYQKFAERGVRDIRGYNHRLKDGEKPLPQIVVIIDELADLMMVAPGEVEDAICRLAQLARAAGIHLVIATQRPSVNVITGVIKANIPSRIAFTVASQVDSRTILDGAGAEKLLGRGDMLFFPQGVGKPQRVQGANVTDDEVNAVTDFIKEQHEAVYNPDILEQMERDEQSDAEREEQKDDDCDPLLPQAVEIAVELGQVSISMLQRRMRIGYARAGRIVDEMTQRGIIGAADGAKPRMLLISREEFKRLYGDKQGD